MKFILNHLKTKHSGNLLSIAVVLFIFLLTLFRLYPFQNTLSIILKEVDDWGRYARYAYEIRHQSFFIGSEKTDYFGPAGFLYNYFIALCFYIFGDNIIPVYIIQNLLLGLSVVFIYFTFRDKMEILTANLFLIALLIFSLLDVFKDYSFRLLSENLALFTISAFFLCMIKGVEKNKLSLKLLSAVFLGMSVLSRPNIFPFAIVLILILIIYSIKEKRITIKELFLYLITFSLSMSLLCIRNHVIVGNWMFLPSEGISFGKKAIGLANNSLSYYIKKAAFCFGILTPVDANYRWRPHWILMWCGFFIYCFFRIKENRKPAFWEAVMLAYIFCYYGLMILVAPQIGCYGFRQLIPATFIVLGFSIMGYDRLLKNARL
jgi:4-amino-4-deoxy-L-arabinose transferase-like glycosyltransferase